MDLMQYLNKYFDKGVVGEYHSNPIQITTHFLEKFGVDIKQENDLFLFKYNMISAKFSFPITWQCRGTILRYDGQWEYVSRPFDKFFNFSEVGFCKLQEDNFNVNYRIVEKGDGTCIQAYYDSKIDKWRISTLGTITTMSYDQAFSPDETFEKLFYKTIGEIDWDLFDKDFTYIFELCSFENRIVTKYDKDICYFLAARNVKNGTYMNYQEADGFCGILQKNKLNVKRPYYKFFFEIGFENFEDVTKWVEEQANNTIYGVNPEGFVIYQGDYPVAKMKNSVYLAAHRVSGGNKAHAKNVIIESFFKGEMDDIKDFLIPELVKFADNIQDAVEKMRSDIFNSCEMLSKKEYVSQKEYALTVQEFCPNKQYHDFFYKNKEAVLNKKNLSELFTEWIKTRYLRFDDLWKNC